MNFVELDVSVLGADRRPIGGLRAADFVVKEDGVIQKIETFEEVVLPEPGPAPAVWWHEVPDDVEPKASAAEGAVVIVYIDDDFLPPALNHRVKAIARAIVDKAGPRDLIAIAYGARNRSSQDFTRDRTLLYAAIDRFMGKMAPPAVPEAGHGPSDYDGDAQAQAQLPGASAFCGAIGAWRRLAALASAFPGRRKAMFLLTVAVPEVRPDNPCYMDKIELFRDARRANVNIYPIKPYGLKGFADVTIESAEDMGRAMANLRGGVGAERTLASNTGGISLSQTNLFNDNIDRIYRENRVYYMVGYHSTNPRTDSKFRSIDVDVNRPGVSVRARSGYHGGDSKKALRLPADPPGRLTAAASSLLPAVDLPMDATAIALREAEEGVLLVTVAVRPDVTVQDDIHVRVVLVREDGRIDRTVERRIVARARAGGEGTPEARVPFVIPANPGRYALRIAATSLVSGRSGSVFLSADVPDFNKARMAMSGVFFAVTPDSPSMAPNAPIAVVPPRTVRAAHVRRARHGRGGGARLCEVVDARHRDLSRARRRRRRGRVVARPTQRRAWRRVHLRRGDILEAGSASARDHRASRRPRGVQEGQVRH